MTNSEETMMNKRPINILKENTQDELAATTEYFLKPSSLAANVIDSVGKSIAKDYIDFQYAKDMLENSLEATKNGDFSKVEEMLFTQSYALSSIFASMMTRASRQDCPSNTQAFMNLALKAQNQSRATLQTLILLKQPSQTSFIKQTNIAHGHQQVNNGTNTEKVSAPQNELLEALHDLDSRKKKAPEPVNS